MLGAAIAAGVLVGTTTTSADAEATTQRSAVPGAEIVNRDAYSQCMDFRSNAPGTVVELATCYGGGTQKWWWDHGSPVSGDHLYSTWNGLCMDLRSNTVGAPIILWGCDSGHTSQQWEKVDVPGSSQFYTLRNHNGLCVDIRSKKSGTPVTMAVCQDGVKSQGWANQG
ncbi:RICIN domain-containing protein [Streptomyces sp. SAS_276]